LSIDAWYVEANVAREVRERTELLRALGQLRAGGARVLCAVSPKTLDPDPDVRSVIESVVDSFGGRIAYAREVGRDGRPELEPALRLQAQLLSRLDVVVAEDLQRPRGALWGRCPWGYRFSPDGMRLEPYPPEQAVVATVRHMRMSGMKLREIVDELRKLGVVSRTGKPLGITRVYELLHGGRPNEPSADGRGER
jgi:hypothetical protein